jgi:hypothetical protein
MPPVGPRPDPPVGQALVVFSGVYQSTVWENVFWLTITGTLTYTTVATLATDLYGIFQTDFLPLMNVGATLEECKVTYYDGAGNPQGSAQASHAGTQSGDGLPANCAALLSWKIPASWRGGKPRSYLAAQTVTSQYSNNEWLDTYVASLETGALAFMTNVNAITLTGVSAVRLGTVSFQHANAWRTPPVAFEYVAVGAQKRICTQRRRLGRELF